MAPCRSLRLPVAEIPHVIVWIKREDRPGARSLPWHTVSAQQMLAGALMLSTIPPFPEHLCSISHPQPAILPAGLAESLCKFSTSASKLFCPWQLEWSFQKYHYHSPSITNTSELQALSCSVRPSRESAGMSQLFMASVFSDWLVPC